MITQERLKEVLDYDTNNGNLVWKITLNSRAIKGTVARTTTLAGYKRVRIDGEDYLQHRLVWLYVYGKLPDKFLDHINGNPSDNTLSNLRECDSSQNQHNRKIDKRNRSGVTGISWSKQNNAWFAQIGINGKIVHLGQFDNLKDAILSRQNAKLHLHPFNPIDR